MAFRDEDHHEASRVQASSAVTALIGAETLARLRGQAFRRYDCCRCGRPGQTDAEPAAVIAERYRLGYAVRVRFAHARCADSQIVEVDAAAPDAAGFGGMLARPAVLEYASGPRFRPLLVLEPKVELSRRTAAGEPVSLWMSGLLERGFTLVRTAGELPGLADGWLLHLAPEAARLLAPDDTVTYEGGLDQPPGWLDLARRGNACVVLIGTIGLYGYLGDDMGSRDLRLLLNQAARPGELVGALVTTFAYKL